MAAGEDQPSEKLPCILIVQMKAPELGWIEGAFRSRNGNQDESTEFPCNHF